MIVNTIQPSGGTKPTSQLVTLAKDNWGRADEKGGITEVKSNEQYIDVSGLSTNEGSQLIHVVPLSGSESGYREYGISCSRPDKDYPGKLLFTYTGSSAPINDIKVYVVMEDLKLLGGSARLSDLRIGEGDQTLSPTFSPDVTGYTAATNNTEDVITATPEDSNADVIIKNETTGMILESGKSASWNAGANMLVIIVTSGSNSMTYKVDVNYAG